MHDKLISLENIDVFVFDFDGVLTNNKVYLNEHGTEFVVCSRSDGLAFDVLRKLNKSAYILSTEKNPVITARAKKLKIDVLQGVDNKKKVLLNLCKNNDIDLNRVLYVGNDINDYHVMLSCGFSACPSDSHLKIKEVATITLTSCGGDGVVRELLEERLGIDFIDVLYTDEEI